MGIFGRADDDADDGGLRRRVDELERRVAALEWALRSAGGQPAVRPSVGAAAEESVSAEVRHLAVLGKKIEAIKVLREQTGLGLKECKDIVDQLAP
ncbi:MAG: ribosomal protein L7/L12 [Mycobacterium sp.]